MPCVTEDGSLGATVSMVSPRSAALAAAMAILERRGMQRIRFTEGLSYGVQTNIEELDGRTVHALASTDALPEHATKAALPSHRFPGEQGWYYHQGDKAGVVDEWFTVAALVNAGH